MISVRHRFMALAATCAITLCCASVVHGASEVKTIDLRTTLESSPLYVVFCARDDTVTGHAFIVLGKEDASKQMSTVDAFGYYPLKPGDVKAVFTKVPGTLADEFIRGTLATITTRLILAVNKRDYDAVDAVRREWSTKEFQLIERDCVTFLIECLKTAGLKAPDRTGLDNFPARYARRVVEVNDQNDYPDGTWQSTDDAGRFQLVISHGSCIWTERSLAGVTLQRTSAVSGASGKFKIERANDDAVLAFLGFQPSLRQEILTQSPQPSFMLLDRKGETITGIWNGLLAIKNAQGKLKELKQPGQAPPKTYAFRRILQ